MELLELMRYRRSIRRYQDRQISRADLERILEAGACAPSAGGGRRTFLVGVRNRSLVEKIGRLNMARFDRSQLSGGYVSADQPSIIDDPAIKSGFYGAPAVCVVFARKDFLYSIPDAFCCVENMALMATELGISSCIVARGEETFDHAVGAALLRDWAVPEGYIARCFLTLGYHDGPYPDPKPRKANWGKIVE